MLGLGITEGDKADRAKALEGAVVEPGHDSVLLDITHSIQSLIECQILYLSRNAESQDSNIGATVFPS